MIWVVHVSAAITHRRIHREDHVRAMDADLARDRATHVDRRLQIAVLKLQEDDVLDSQDLGGFALLRRADIAETFAGHIRVLGPRRAVRDHAIRELDAGLHPLGDGSGHSELGVIGVRIYRHRALDIKILVELHLLSVRVKSAAGGTGEVARRRGLLSERPLDGGSSRSHEGPSEEGPGAARSGIPAAYRARAMRRASGHAPGRINLIGEHTDYNDGLVMPIALRLGVTVQTTSRDDTKVRLTSDARISPPEASYELGDEQKDGSWVDRARGVTAMLAREGIEIRGFDAEVRSDLPVGAGLGSSAAFAIALLRSLSKLFDLALDDAASARIAHAAETEFAGARAGMLDQLASVYGRPKDALLIDMRDHGTQVIPLPPDIELAVIDSGTRHEHATGGYNQRRAECEQACLHLGIASLRDIDESPLNEILDRLPAPLDRRVRHVVTENARVRRAVGAVRARDDAELGELLSASHRSLRDDYEVSTPELDDLVRLATAAGALGARMVGGGFGGSVIALAQHGRGRDLAAGVLAGYRNGGRLVAIVP